MCKKFSQKVFNVYKKVLWEQAVNFPRRGAKIRIYARKKAVSTWDLLGPPLLAALLFSGSSSDQFILKFVRAVTEDFVSNI